MSTFKFDDANFVAELARFVVMMIVKETNAAWEPNLISVELVSVTDDMVEFTARVKLPKMTSSTTMYLLKRLDHFCTNEEYFSIRDKKFLLGDGDDSDAVWMEDGSVLIWLRHWPKGK